MANVSVTYSFSNSTTADATQVNQNFTDIINGTSDGTKDFSIAALTCSGNATLNGTTNTIGNASSDDLVITASLASSIAIKTTNTYNIGSSTLGLASIYFGANSQTVRILASGSASATWTLTLPVSAGTSGYMLTTNGSGVTSWTQPVQAATQSEMEALVSSTAMATPSNVNWHPGAAKAWVRFDGTGTPSISANYNISSITDGGTGTYSVNFSTAFSGATTYCGYGISNGSAAASGAGVQMYDASTTAFSFYTNQYTDGAIDRSAIFLAFHGDQS